MNVKFQTVPTKYLMRMIIPIAFGKTLALASSFFGLWKIPVSYAQTGNSKQQIMIEINCSVF